MACPPPPPPFHLIPGDGQDLQSEGEACEAEGAEEASESSIFLVTRSEVSKVSEVSEVSEKGAQLRKRPRLAARTLDSWTACRIMAAPYEGAFSVLSVSFFP